jgi:flagellar basal body-associated protein FliL
MQRCQKCGRTYPDDKQKFCTFDGGRLEIDSDGAPTVLDLNKTIQANLPAPQQGTTAPITAPVPDLSKTVAGDQSATTSEFKSYDTGPTQTPTSSSLQPPVSAPLPPAQTPSAPLATPVAQTSKKSSKLPWIIGGMAALLLLGLGAGGVMLWFLTSKSVKPSGGGTTINSNAGESANNNTSNNANDNATTANANTSTAAPPNSTQFVNSRQNLNSLLGQHYTDFSFYYPRAWTLNTQARAEGSSNFVKVERLMPPNFTQEEFAVSYYDSKGTLEADRAVFPVLVEKLNAKFSAGYPEYRKVSEGETKVNGIDGYEFRYQGMSRGTEKGDISLWGRVIFLPPGVEGNNNGVTLLIFTTSIAPELKSIDDVGVRGELPVILNSFKLGR